MAIGDTLGEYFGFDEHGTDLRTETLAGLTTFLTMSYIVVVNPAILSVAIDIPGRSDAIVVQNLAVVTILAATVSILVMAVYANRPFALAPGLGLNAYFAFVVVLGLGVPWQTALLAVVVEGVLFMALTLAGAREYVIALIPTPVKFAVGAGIGAFLAIIGLQQMRVIAGHTPGLSPTFVQFNPVFILDPIAVASVIGLLITLVLYARGVRGSIVIGILLTSVLGYAAAALGFRPVPRNAMQPDTAGYLLADVSLTPGSPLQYTAAGYDISPLVGAFVSGLGDVSGLTLALVVFTFFFVDFFDTAGTLTGVSQVAGFLDEEGNLPEIEKPLLADSIGTTIGGMLGTSTVTTYIESSTGIEEGGRTGMTALVVGVLFLLSLAVVPLAAAIPLYASHIALVVVAIIMFQNITEIAWSDITEAAPAALTILAMPFLFNISWGIAAGIITYPVIKAAKDGSGSVRPGHWVLAGAFVLYFVGYSLANAGGL
jgi:AGZA family xanthine/uracil permease-like MFS transporter